MAAALLRFESPGHTLPPTALVSELYLKLHRFRGRLADEEHFFRIAARAMRQVLTDHARVRKPKKWRTVNDLSDSLVRNEGRWFDPVREEGTRQVWEQLRDLDETVAEAVWLNCVEDVSVAVIARRQRRAAWRVREDIDFGLDWLRHRYRR
ncbi:MAG TPA: hypothetical protein DEH78_30255 [Solibacterales bacterium]|nr:hypothetical protein [Bryobacterales bacterium]